MKIEVVSIPAISSGIFRFPKDKCAEIMIKYTIAWFKNGDCGSVKTIRFCNFDIVTTLVFLEETCRLLGLEFYKERLR